MRGAPLRGKMPDVKPYRLGPEQGHAVWNSGGLMTFKATGADTRGRFWLMEYLVGPGTTMPLHSHAGEDQAWYVIEGDVRCTVGELTFKATPATFVYVPRGVLRGLTVETSSARLLILGTPSGAEHFFWETGEPAGALTLPPCRRPPDPDRLAAARATYGVQVPEPQPVDHATF